jgi:hypothetical protein
MFLSRNTAQASPGGGTLGRGSPLRLGAPKFTGIPRQNLLFMDRCISRRVATKGCRELDYFPDATLFLGRKSCILRAIYRARSIFGCLIIWIAAAFTGSGS